MNLPRKTWMKRGGPLRRKSKKRRALEPKVKAAKDEWSASLPDRCWVCGATRNIVTHHIMRGHLARMEQNDKPWAWFKICDPCHDDHWHNTPPARQMAFKMKNDPENYNLMAYLKARNERAMEYVTQDEVDAELEAFGDTETCS